MKDTPIQKAITQVSLFINNVDPQTKTRGYLIAVLHELHSLLPYERECIEGAYDAGIATTSGMQTSDFKCGTKYYTQTFKQ